MAAAARTVTDAVPAGESVVKTESMLPFEDEPAVSDQDIELPPGKQSFTPEELYRFTRIKPFVLRFWESEFPALKPKKDASGGMAYGRSDVERILAIKKILYEEGLTLVEARQRLSGGAAPADDAPDGAKAGKALKTAQKKPRAAEKSAAPRKVERTGTVAGKKSTASPGKRATAKKAVKTSAAAKSKSTVDEQGKGRRGLPAEGASRTRVSLEELLPDNMNAPEGKAPGKPPARPSKPPRSKAKRGPTESPELARALSGAVRELRAILTLLRKGDR